jgi:peptide/nickel transport system ATP-binding protein
MSEELLRIDDLHVAFSTRRGMVEAVRGVTLTVAKGEMLGLVGESGSGKSVTGFATTRLLDAAGRVTGGKILFRGQDVTKLGGDDLRQLQGAAMSMIFQNPRAALNPIRAIGLQIADAILTHKKISKDAARAEALELLRAVQIRDPETRMNAYPHELSGGMCQRVMIAIAISCNPSLLIADEPTTGLDVTTQKVVMDLLAEIAAARGMATILITHDLGLAARYCRRIAVMERGRIVEEASPKTLFSTPQHAYTKRLVAASPTATSRIEDLVTEEEREGYAAVISRPRHEPAYGTPPLLEVRKLAKRFDQGSAAVADFSMTMAGGESVGLVGESGSGKSTTSRMICRLIDPSEGDIVFDGQSIGHVASRDFHRSPLRKDIQMVFQDPNESLNPRYTAFDCIAHPLMRLDGMRGGDPLRKRVEECAERVGLPLDLCRASRTSSPADRRPASASPAPLPAGRGCWCWTSRPPRSTSRCRRWCCNCSIASGARTTSRCCSSATISTWCVCSATAPSCCAMAASSSRGKAARCSTIRRPTTRASSSRRSPISTPGPRWRLRFEAWTGQNGAEIPLAKARLVAYHLHANGLWFHLL